MLLIDRKGLLRYLYLVRVVVRDLLPDDDLSCCGAVAEVQ